MCRLTSSGLFPYFKYLKPYPYPSSYFGSGYEYATASTGTLLHILASDDAKNNRVAFITNEMDGFTTSIDGLKEIWRVPRTAFDLYISTSRGYLQRKDGTVFLLPQSRVPRVWMLQLGCEGLDDDDGDDEMWQSVRTEWESITDAKNKGLDYDVRNRDELED